MARRLDIPEGVVFVGNASTLGIPVVDEATKEPFDLTPYDGALEFTVRDTPAAAATRLVKTTEVTTQNHNGVVPEKDMALVPIYFDDAMSGTAIVFSGLKWYTLRELSSDRVLAWGTIFFTVVTGRG